MGRDLLLHAGLKPASGFPEASCMPTVPTSSLLTRESAPSHFTQFRSQNQQCECCVKYATGNAKQCKAVSVL